MQQISEHKTVDEKKTFPTVPALADEGGVTVADCHCPSLLGRVTCRHSPWQLQVLHHRIISICLDS